MKCHFNVEKFCVGALLAMLGGAVFGYALEASTQIVSAVLAVLCAFAMTLSFYVLNGAMDCELESISR